MNTVTNIAAVTFKAKLLTLIYKTAREEDVSDEIAEVNTFTEQRCRHEFVKIENLYTFADELRNYINEGGCLRKMDDMPLMQDQQEAQNFMVEEFKAECVQEKRAEFKLV
ncbi:MAG: hypothetical protein ACI9TY_000981 [Alphaproteobacteria bacterium]|jgi:hypothetical protein